MPLPKQPVAARANAAAATSSSRDESSVAGALVSAKAPRALDGIALAKRERTTGGDGAAHSTNS
jgi:hypothetical protein